MPVLKVTFTTLPCARSKILGDDIANAHPFPCVLNVGFSAYDHEIRAKLRGCYFVLQPGVEVVNGSGIYQHQAGFVVKGTLKRMHGEL
jgi:hypothetical protein